MSDLAGSLLLVEFGGRQQLIERKKTLRAAIKTAVDELELQEEADDFELTLAIGDLDAPLGASAYAKVLQQKSLSKLKLRQKAGRREQVDQPRASASQIKKRAPTPFVPLSASTSQASLAEDDEEESSPTDMITIRVLGHDLKSEQISIRRYSKLKRVLKPYAKRHGLNEDDLAVFHHSKQAAASDTPDGLGMSDRDTLVISSLQPSMSCHALDRYIAKKELAVGKPQIYFMSQKFLPEVTVTLALSSASLQFGASQPPATQQVHSKNSSISWTISVDSDGTLRSRNDQQSSDHLTWAFDDNNIVRHFSQSAIAMGYIPAEDRTSPFRPGPQALKHKDTILLPVEQVESYLRKTLVSLSVQEDARDNFIMSLSPAFKRHSYISLRFLPSSEMDDCAPLSIQPRPGAITRIFLLFKGLSELDQGQGKRIPVRDWSEIVGVPTLADYGPAFRVVECELPDSVSESIAHLLRRWSYGGLLDSEDGCSSVAEDPIRTSMIYGAFKYTSQYANITVA